MKWSYGIAGTAVLAVAFGAYRFIPANEMQKETQPLAVEAVSAISEKWDAEALKERADPGLIKAMGSQGQSPEDLMRIYSTLGKLKAPADCSVHNTGSFTRTGAQQKTISYECAASYENGPAVVSLTFSKGEDDSAWVIYYINIHSDVFEQIIE